ncbi:adenylyltransferase/cytidyltransferase family protein [Patescibacteria group bacterium]|nr:adenylyltransferase/cytidyltransferase family protein [Patescibacteria group bacterium]
MKKRVVVFGIFDGIHDGHRSLFRQAKRYGDELVVVIGRDSASLKWKGKNPKYNQETRRALVLKEEQVDQAVLGDEEQSSYKVLENLNPDGICLGYDQDDLAQDLRLWLKKMGRETPIYILKLHHPHINHTSFLS